MKVIAYDRFKPGVTMETITPLLPEEVANVWRLWKAGIVRGQPFVVAERGRNVSIALRLRDAASPVSCSAAERY